jgi:hypothetical protein
MQMALLLMMMMIAVIYIDGISINDVSVDHNQNE